MVMEKEPMLLWVARSDACRFCSLLSGFSLSAFARHCLPAAQCLPFL